MGIGRSDFPQEQAPNTLLVIFIAGRFPLVCRTLDFDSTRYLKLSFLYNTLRSPIGIRSKAKSDTISTVAAP